MKHLLLTTLLLTASRLAGACSYDLRDYDTVEKRFNASEIVVVADVVTSVRNPFTYPDGYKSEKEVVTFRVVEVFKGDVKSGAHLVTETALDSSCALNVRNSPPIIEDVKGGLVKTGKRWLLYLAERRPFQLEQTPGSFPVKFLKKDLKELRRLKGAATVSHPAGARIRAPANRKKELIS